jgi:hypothetical protein
MIDKRVVKVLIYFYENGINHFGTNKEIEKILNELWEESD